MLSIIFLSFFNILKFFQQTQEKKVPPITNYQNINIILVVTARLILPIIIIYIY